MVTKPTIGQAGWGEVLNAALDELEAAAEANVGVDPADVGYDVILLAGQSNMSGRGTGVDTSRYDVSHPDVQQWGAAGTYANLISQAVEPLAHADAVALAGDLAVGPGLSLARWYKNAVAPNRRVLLVPFAYGGTGFTTSHPDTWDPAAASGSLYLRAIAAANAAVTAAGANARFVGIFWVQGEADTSLSQSAYAAKLDALISGMRAGITAADETTPFVIGQMVPEFIAGNASRQAIDAAHQATPTRVAYTGFAAASSGYALGDNLHFTAAGQRIQGRRLFDALLLAQVNDDVAPAAPAQVTGLGAASAGTTSVLLSWSAPASGGSAITDYVVQYRQTAPGGAWTTFADGTTATPGTTVTGLSTGVGYDFQVAAVNAVGTGSFSATATATPTVPATVPAQVTGLVATPGSGQVGLTWTAPSNGGSAITDYKVEYKATASGTWLTFADAVSTTTAATVTSLTNGTPYDFRVSAINAVGTGTASATASATPAVAVIAQDTFNRADASTLGTTDSGSKAWTAHTGTWGIRSNAAALITATNVGSSPFNVASVEASDADVTVSVKITQSSSTDAYGFIFRATDGNNHFLCRINGTYTGLELFKVVSGSVSSIANRTATFNAAATGNTIGVILSGSSIQLTVNGSNAGAVITDATHQTATRHGLWCNGEAPRVNLGVFDDFSVLP